MKKENNLVQKVIGTLALPVIMFIIMFIICHVNGKTYYGTWAMWRTLIVDIAVATLCAMGIGLQFNAGRFDFSGGAIMLVATITAGNLAKQNGNNLLLFIGVSLSVCVLLSLGVALFYVFGRLPIVITTIGMALLYESITSLIFGGGGISLVSNMTLRKISTFPGVLIPFAAAVMIYAFYCNWTTAGKQATLLANSQQSAVNIGINEKKNVIITYLFSGLIFGLATCIYASLAMRNASYSALSTVGELFVNILPVFIALILRRFCDTTIGILVGATAICLMNYGLSAVLSAELGSALATILMGVFVLLINVIGAQGHHLKKLLAVFKKPVRSKV